MLSDPTVIDLVHMEDVDGNRCIVRMAGPVDGRGVGHHNYPLYADVLLSTSFLNARLEVVLADTDLRSWQEDLARMEIGGDAVIDSGGGLRLRFHWRPDGLITVDVDAPGRLRTRVWIRHTARWLTEHQSRVHPVWEAWPPASQPR